MEVIGRSNYRLERILPTLSITTNMYKVRYVIEAEYGSEFQARKDNALDLCIEAAKLHLTNAHKKNKIAVSREEL